MNKKFAATIIVCLGFIMGFCALNSGADAMRTVKDNTLRLHILANSDSEQDQSLKLSLRDYLLQTSGDWFTSCQSKEDAKLVLTQRQEQLTDLANSFLQSCGSAYTATVAVSNDYFPTKVYGQYAMPAGNYDALRIVIGSGQGKNWWCVLFPQMCVTAAGEVDLSAVYGDDGVQLIKEEDVDVRFKVCEWWDLLKERFADKQTLPKSPQK